MRNAANAKSRPRSRKRTTAIAAPEAAPELSAAPAVANATGRNVGPLESMFSLGLGVLFVVGALFPRSIKQLLLLGLGGGLVYRGMTSHCGLYQALGLDSEKGSLVDQVNEKYLSGASDDKG